MTLKSFKFPQYHGLVYGFSTRDDGNMKLGFRNFNDNKTRSNIINFCKKLAGFSKCIITMKQVHANEIAVVGKKDCNKVIPGVDGLITDNRQIFLLAAVADCLPMVFYNQKLSLIGITHAGWKGTLENIVSSMINKLKTEFNSEPKNTTVFFGPSISSCCYQVQSDVFEKFKQLFGDDPQICQQINDKLAIDLRVANFNQLIAAGVLKDNIIAPIYCTFCQNDLFFSFRKEKDKLAGEIAAVAALK